MGNEGEIMHSLVGHCKDFGFQTEGEIQYRVLSRRKT